jgi:hypothetical protein
LLIGVEIDVDQPLSIAPHKGRFGAALSKLWAWMDTNIIDLGRQMRLSYLPPLMVYMAAGIS